LSWFKLTIKRHCANKVESHTLAMMQLGMDSTRFCEQSAYSSVPASFSDAWHALIVLEASISPLKV